MSGRRYLFCVFSLIAIACDPGHQEQHRFELSNENAQGSIVYPVLRRDLRGRPDSVVMGMADIRARRCLSAISPESSQGEPVSTVDLPGLGTLRISLPRGYNIKSDRSLRPTNREGTPSEHILASWSSSDLSVGEDSNTRELIVWISSDSGYPTVALPFKTRQTEIRECSILSAGAFRQFVLFVIDSPKAPATYYVAAFWKLGPRLWTRSLGRALDRQDQEELAKAVGAMTFEIDKK